MTHTCSLLPVLHSLGPASLCHTGIPAGLGKSGRKLCLFTLCCSWLPPWGTSDKAPDNSHLTSSTYLFDIWDLHLLLRPFLQQWFSPYFFQAASSFLKPLALFISFSLLYFSWTSISSFPSLSSLHAETFLLSQLMALCYASLINWRIQEMTLLCIQIKVRKLQLAFN